MDDFPLPTPFHMCIFVAPHKESAVASQGQQMRRVRDRTVARVHALVTEIRDYGKHAYRRNPKLSAAFAPEYVRRKRRRAAGQQEPESPVAPTA